MKTKQGLEYAVSFDTKEMPGKLVAVTVSLDKTVMALEDEIRLDLCDHPLYRHLHSYCAANPPSAA